MWCNVPKGGEERIYATVVAAYDTSISTVCWFLRCVFSGNIEASRLESFLPDERNFEVAV